MIDVSHLSFRFPTTTKLIVAVSGGADSVALLDILHQAGFPCVVAHCNFHLRGAESDRDEAFVRSLANHYHLPFRKIDFQTLAYASIQSISVEMAARELRYDWFRQLLVREGAKVIAVAHHSDDVIETFLMNMSRGTGIKGLTGIKELTDNVWRPLLSVSRKDINDYLQIRGLSHVEDSTNADTLYTRNKFRNEIIPLLQSVYPTFKENLLNTIANLRQTEDFIRQQLQEKKEALFQPLGNNQYKIPLSLLREETSLSFLLYELLTPYGFSSSTIENIVRSLPMDHSGHRFYNKQKSWGLVQERDHLLVYPISAKQEEEFEVRCEEDFLKLPIAMDCQLLSVSNCNIQKDALHCYLDQSKVSFPLVLRRWRKGDWFVPFGMKGKKKLSDFFIDQKMTNEEKERLWVLTTKDDDIVWIVGYRSDNRYRITENTVNVYVLEIKGGF